MNYEKFLKDDLVKKQAPDFKQIEYQLKRAQKDLVTAGSNLSIDFIYDSVNHITPHEAKASIETAKKLIEEITALIAKENPEKDLFH